MLESKTVELAEMMRAAGGRAMIVGGCVRDELMGIEPKDWDLEVYGVEAERLKEILEAFAADQPLSIVGAAFAVYKIGHHIDVSIPRRERKAILKDPLTGEIVDPFNGRDDIDAKVLRHVNDATFGEDSLRVLRASQFAARLKFDIDPKTVEICREIDLSDLPKERIWGELEKILLLADEPSKGLKWLYSLKVADKLFPELQTLVGVPQEPEWHPEGDVDVHTMMVADEARKLIDDLPYEKKVTVMLAAVAHDFGKPPTTKFFDGRWRSHSHDEAGVEPTISFLDRLGLYTINGFDVREQVIQLVRYHLKPGEFYKANAKQAIGDGAFRRLARKVEPDLLYRVAKADSLGRNPEWLPLEKRFGSEAQEWFIERVRDLKIEKRPPEPILLGRHLIELGLEPSRQFKTILDAVYEMQLDGKVNTLDEAVEAAREILSGNAPQGVRF